MVGYKIKVPLYNQTVGVYFDIASYHKDYPEYTNDGDNGCYGFVQNRNIVIVDYNPNTVVHECLHAAWQVLDDCGVKVTHDNDEPLAYVLGYIYEAVINCHEHYLKREAKREQKAAQAKEQADIADVAAGTAERPSNRSEPEDKPATGD